MADNYDALGLKLGIPPQLLPAWKAQVAPPVAPVAPSGPAPLRPGDPGWSLTPTAPAMPGPSSPAPPPGPRPGDPGFNITQLAPPRPAPVPAPSRPGGPLAKPMSREQQKAADIAALQGTNEEFAKLNGKPALTLTGDVGRRAYDMAKGTEDNIKSAFKAEENRKNLDGATFNDDSGGVNAGIAGAGRPFMISPGGRRAGAWSVQEGAPIGTEEKDAAELSDRHSRNAAGYDYEAGKAQAEYERGYLDRLEGAHVEHANEQKQRADGHEREYSKHVGELDALRAQIREAKIDPTGGLGGAGRLAGAIAMALGAFGSRRGENHGLDAVKHTIGENIRQQEVAINKIERGMKGETNFLGMLKQKYGDIEHAKDAAWIGMLEKSKVELAKILGSPDIRDPQLQSKYERMLAATDKELEQRYASWDGRTRDKIVRHDVNEKPVYGGIGGGKHDREDAKWLADKYDTAKIPEALATIEGVDQQIDTFGSGDIEGVGKFAQHVPNAISSDRAVANRQKWQGLKNQIGHGLFGGALSPTESENLSKQLDGAHDAASLRRVVQDFRTMIHHKQRNLGGGVSASAKVTYDQQGGSVRPIPLDKPASPHIKEAK